MAAILGVLEQAGLKLDADGAIATVTLNRPERRNAMSPSMWHGLAAIGDALPTSTRVVIVRGEGSSFSAGIDLRLFTPDGIPGEELASPADPGFEAAVASYQAGYLWLRRPDIVFTNKVQRWTGRLRRGSWRGRGWRRRRGRSGGTR